MVFFGESTNIGRVCSLVVILLGADRPEAIFG
jgi:hypothetical protein